ncbi:MAG: hypothetical protein A3D94_19545 [Alphaproteobacteria bacterium RIFCSPHIGHO2_12_FULL_66_14]|nr:MAG: hypothetical protein A3D94_19545 [Alphaproteobacteria bacterium RIFCSPHIGHO2_12_FULL_66_14]
MKSLNWLLRGLLGLAGVLLAYQAWPVARGAWQAQKADAVAQRLRTGQPVELADVAAGIVALDRAVAADPVAGRYLQRSELVVGAALTPSLNVTLEQRVAWLRSAESDLVAGLGNAPARGVAWARLASVRQGLQGTSRGVVDALLMSIDTSPLLSPIWPARLQLILDNWVAFTPQERERMAAYVVMTWRLSSERRWFAQVIRSPVDELFVRYFLRDEPNAQAELAKWLFEVKRDGK